MALPKLDMSQLEYEAAPVDYKFLDQIFKQDYPSFADTQTELDKRDLAEAQTKRAKLALADDEVKAALREKLKGTTFGEGDTGEDDALKQLSQTALQVGDIDTFQKLETQRANREQNRLSKKFAQYNQLLRFDPTGKQATDYAAANGLDALANLDLRERRRYFSPTSGLSVLDPSTGQAVEMAAPQQRASTAGARMIQMINNRGEIVSLNARDEQQYNALTKAGFHERSKAEGQYDPYATDEGTQDEGPGFFDRASDLFGSMAGKSNARPDVIPKAGARTPLPPPPVADPSKESLEEYKRRVRGF